MFYKSKQIHYYFAGFVNFLLWLSCTQPINVVRLKTNKTMSLLRSFAQSLSFIDYHNVATLSLFQKQRSFDNMVESEGKIKTKPRRGDTSVCALTLPDCKWIEYLFAGHQ